MSIRELLSDLRVFDRPLPRFAPEEAPPHPDSLFASWLRQAVRDGVTEPHAMSLSTVDAGGLPDTRIVLLREIDDRGWQFSTDAESAKGRQAADRPAAALGFYWREQGRQVRVRGTLSRLDPETSRADFLSKSPGSRAASLAGRQSAVLTDPAHLIQALADADEVIERDPRTIAGSHTVYAVVPVSVEFWQGDSRRRHVRLRYRKERDTWHKELLWP
ncbi:pyridoxine/pyridoxamine 5'-phosphate oxidase [Actinoplanes ianthinogenes]|uniref:pyridoxine/pyridoxamine 5'-phosphate oxidase n=1 Tax=Actinoplanes ianthinogenes TaxID=122358 RepID=UPI0016701B1F|nr:pyridoxal 5'-phosphate synthase [Actinoplanes ianthinogenes]